ncbi:MAG: Co2+/Mg2+ efflux protein ApaG [Pseudomonadota bacterium]
MYSATTRKIRVSVTPDYAPDQSEPDNGAYFWTYTIEITNLGLDRVQLISRHWLITDANGKTFEVRGPGVVGEQPVLGPGESFTYTSGVPLSTTSGTMTGSYQMVDVEGRDFEVDVPAFSLDSPYASQTLN